MSHKRVMMYHRWPRVKYTLMIKTSILLRSIRKIKLVWRRLCSDRRCWASKRFRNCRMVRHFSLTKFHNQMPHQWRVQFRIIKIWVDWIWQTLLGTNKSTTTSSKTQNKQEYRPPTLLKLVSTKDKEEGTSILQINNLKLRTISNHLLEDHPSSQCSVLVSGLLRGDIDLIQIQILIEDRKWFQISIIYRRIPYFLVVPMKKVNKDC